MDSPPAELDVDEAQVRALLVEQHPDLADLPIVELAAGWDNTLWRLGADLLVRLPRRAVAAFLTVNEQRWLPAIAPDLPLPVSVPLRAGRPSDEFPWPWSIVPWIDGVPGDRATITDPEAAAAQLGAFLRALHREAPADAPRNPFRGVPLSERAETFADRLAELVCEIDGAATRRVWDRARDAPPFTGPPRWLHGDLHPANVVVGPGGLAGVIDFGDISAGDPATDLAAAWMLLPASVTPTFAASYGGIAADLEARALGWAVLFGLMLLSIGLADRPTYATVGRVTLARTIAVSAAAS